MGRGSKKSGLRSVLKVAGATFLGASVAAAAVGQFVSWRHDKKHKCMPECATSSSTVQDKDTSEDELGSVSAPASLDKYAVIAEMVAADNLDAVNAASSPVTPKNSFYTRHVKRLFDVFLAAPCVVVTLPVNAALGVLTYFDVGSPVLFKQKRLGKDNVPFNLVKFRNMTNETDENGNLLPASMRTTKFGAFVRSKSLDEFLNFWFILTGDMSFIGPRPLPAEFLDRYSDRHRQRTAVKPGLECPTLDSDGHVRLYQEQFENDIWYVENVSFKVDCKMVAALFKMVFNRKERADHATVGGGYFVGYDSDGSAFSMRRIPEEYELRYQQLVEND